MKAQTLILGAALISLAGTAQAQDAKIIQTSAVMTAEIEVINMPSGFIFTNAGEAKVKKMSGQQMREAHVFGTKTYASVSDSVCRNKAKLTHFKPARKAQSEVEVVASDQPYKLLAYTSKTGGGGNYPDGTSMLGGAGWRNNDCTSLATFTPKSGGRYIAYMGHDAKGQCSMTVVDAMTKAEPADLKISDQHICG